MKLIFLTNLMILTCFSFAYNQDGNFVDSLKPSLQYAKEDTNKIIVLNKLSFGLYSINVDDGIKYAESAMKLAEKLEWEKGIADANNNLGVCYWIRADYPRAMNYFYKALEINEAMSDKYGQAITLNNLGLIFIRQNNYVQALKFYLKALSINEKLGNKKSIIRNLNNIADAYSNLKDFRRALEYFYRTLRLNEELNDSINIGVSLTNIGNIFIEKKEYSKGLECFYQSLRMYKDDNELNNGYNFQEIGRAYFLMTLNQSNNNNTKKLLAQSVKFLQKSIECFQNVGSLYDLQQSYYYIYKASRELNDYFAALKYFEKSSALKDSIFSIESKNMISNLAIQREVDLRDKQIVIQELKIKNKARLVYLLISITIAIALVSSVFFWLYISKRKINWHLEEKNKTISEINAEKDKFFSIIAHDLRSPFNSLLGFSRILEEELHIMTQDQIQKIVGSLRRSATSVYRLLENLLDWSRFQRGFIPYNPEPVLLMPKILAITALVIESANKKEIDLSYDIPEDLEVFADEYMLDGILRNLAINAVKFTPKGGKVTVAAKPIPDGWVEVSVKDIGIGMNQQMVKNLFKLNIDTSRKGTDNEPSTGLGLIICKDFIEKYGGKLWVESEEGKGSTFYFTLPSKQDD